MALFPLTLSNAQLPQTTPFSRFCITFRIFVVGGDKDLDFLDLNFVGRQASLKHLKQKWSNFVHR